MTNAVPSYTWPHPIIDKMIVMLTVINFNNTL